MVRRIGAHAVGERLELGQILLDLSGIQRNVGIERALAAPEWSIGDAIELLAWTEWSRRHVDHRSEPSPNGNNYGRHHCEQRSGSRHRQSPSGRVLGVVSLIAQPRRCQARLRLRFFDRTPPEPVKAARASPPNVFFYFLRAAYWRRHPLRL